MGTGLRPVPTCTSVIPNFDYSVICRSDFLTSGHKFHAAGYAGPSSCSKYRYGTLRALLNANSRRLGPLGNQEVTEMQNLDLTKLLEMVWAALKEQDERKRDHLLHAADAFLQNDNQLPDSAPPRLDRKKTAA